MILIKKHHKRLTRFFAPMVMTALLCITSPSFAQIPNTLNTAIPKEVATAIAQNKNISNASLKQTPLGSDSQAASLYNKKQFAEAAKLFEQSAKAYQTAKNPIQQALSLSNLSLCYQQLGRWDDASRVITESIKLLSTTEGGGKLTVLAQSYDIQGELQLARGQGDAALKSWQRVTSLYTQQNKPSLVLASQTNQAQALQSLGLYRRAIILLETALKLPPGSTEEQLLKTPQEISENTPQNIQDTTTLTQLKTLLQKIPASSETATALHSLGESLRVVGNLPQANLVLQRSLAIANQLQLPETSALVQLSLGNAARTQVNPDTAKIEPQVQTALNFYQQVATSASVSTDLKVQAQVNQLSLLVDTNQSDAAKKLLPQVQQQIEALPKSQTGIEGRVNLAQTMMQMRKNNSGMPPMRDIAQILAVAVQQAQDLGNPRTQAFALGTLGNVYEQTQQWAEAEKLTTQAVQLAQQINAGDISYLWQWQLGRVMKAQGKIDSAIAAYKEAVGTIKALRADLASANPNVQFSFRDAVEPIHRELVALLVQSTQKDNLKTARDVIEGLQLVELDNFFREACLTGNPEQIDQVDRRAAVIYPIILEDQLATIVSLPKSEKDSTNPKDNRNYRYYKTGISSQEIEELASSLQNNLNQDTALDFTLPKLQKVYDLVLRPEAADLTASKVETLVFVLDGVLRNIPMAALHDGKQYLVEKYSIALTPGLQLLAPRSRKQQTLGALVAGLSESRSNFKALPSVKDEIKNIESEIPTQVLLNQKFTNSAFKNGVSAVSYPIVHLATHGQFSSKPEDTYILTWDSKIKVNELSGVLKTAQISRNNALELLVLSACETATGDTRSALGLAGVAVRSGARTTVATLWSVNDQASAMLISEFYNQLVKGVKTGVSKAEALRRAQLSILQNTQNPQYKSPYYWGAYVMLGNWV